MRACLVIALAAVAALLAAPGAQAATRTVETVSAGPVTAQLSYVKRRGGDGRVLYTDKRVSIERGGVAYRDEALPTGRCDDEFCVPLLASAKARSIRLRDLDGDGEPEVLVDMFTGGAYCCVYTFAYGFQPAAGTYRRATHDFGSYGYKQRDLGHDGRIELVSRDFRFYGAFSCGACGILPIQVLGWSGSGFKDVTRRQRPAVRADARRIRRAYLHNRRRGIDFARGYLNAYVADQCLLGSCRTGFREVERARRGGYLTAHRGDLGPSGRAYAHALGRLLRRYGYRR